MWVGCVMRDGKMVVGVWFRSGARGCGSEGVMQGFLKLYHTTITMWIDVWHCPPSNTIWSGFTTHEVARTHTHTHMSQAGVHTRTCTSSCPQLHNHLVHVYTIELNA